MAGLDSAAFEACEMKAHSERETWFMNYCRCVLYTLCAIGVLLAANPAGAQQTSKVDYLRDEMPALPAPDWVEMRDVGEVSPKLKGMRTPKGVSVQIVAQDPQVVDPVGMTFADDGSLYVLEWREATEQVDTTYDVHYQDGTTATVNRKTKNVLDELKRLTDTDDDGNFDAVETVMDDLEMPSSLLLHDGWMYLPSIGHVIRRRPADGQEGAFQEEEILRGMCGYHHHQVSGLTIGHDNWMYTTTGDDDNIAEGSDGSRSTVLRTGAIFRSRPDGSHLSEFARGFRNPYRNVVFDELYNMFHVDNDQEDGSKFQGVRLMHLLEGADYGWRLELGAKCCRTDFSRGAVFGERPGKMPSLLKTGRGAPAGLLVYQGTAFPDAFRGLLIYPDVYRMKVRAYEIERRGSTFEVIRQFTLMESDDGMFRPVQAVVGPDGAIYILDWRTNSGGAGRSWGDGEHGRVYRLTWDGTDTMPAVAPGPMAAWSSLNKMSDTQLLNVLATTRDFELRERAQKALTGRGKSSFSALEKMVHDASLAAPARISAFGAICRLDWSMAESSASKLLSDSNPDLRRLAAESFGRHFSSGPVSNATVEKLLKSAANDPHPAVRRAAALAAGNAGQSAPNNDRRHEIASRLMSILLTTSADDVFLFDGILRGIERCGAAGVRKVVDLTRSDEDDHRELATVLLTSLRTREAALAVDKLLGQDTSRFNETQMDRLLSVHRHILVRPPISADSVRHWLEKHPKAAASLQVTALQTLGLVGGGRSDTVQQLTVKLLNWPDADIRLAAIKAAGELRVKSASPSLFAAIKDEKRSLDERREIIRTLALLKAEDWPFADRADQGVELILPELTQEIESLSSPELVADALWLTGQVDLEKATSLATRFLDSDNTAILEAAIDVLSADMQQAQQLGQRWLDSQLPKELRPQVAAALQRHAAADTTGKTEQMLKDLYRDGLKISLEPAAVARIKKLVVETGNPERGREVFLRPEKSQCIKCHRVEGVGGNIGPDLNNISQTHTIEKIIESIADPSREIKEGFDTWTIVTTEGKVYGGLRISEGPPQFVLRGANGRDYRIYVDDIEEKIQSKRSLMPDGTVSQLSLTELVDLIAFLKDEQAQKGLPAHAKVRSAKDN